MPKTQNLRASQRFSNTTPEGLRKRILSAIPEWEKIPRNQRQAIAMLPIYGTFEDAWDSVKGHRKDPASALLGRTTAVSRAVSKIVKDWESTGDYPEHTRTYEKRKRSEKRETVTTKTPLTQAEILQQLANEMAAMALIKAESSMSPAAAAKLAEQSGWFLNIEAEVEKQRAYTDQRIGKMLNGLNNRKPADDEPSIPEFEEDQDVDDDFTGETKAATEGSEPAVSGANEHVDDPEPGDVVQTVPVAGESPQD